MFPVLLLNGMSGMKIIANYLPQYHVIPENSAWWGEGYTDWTAVKKAKQIIDGQVQPKVPLGGKYRYLDDIESIRWQVKLAHEYGIDGFGIYHYWFNSDMQLLQTPSELIRDNSDIDINYLFIWDNCSWRRTWSNVKKGNDWAPTFDQKKNEASGLNGMLAELDYGTEADWDKHFDYLLTHFSDDRYIKVEGKPVFCIMKPRNDFSTIGKMVAHWNNRAIDSGFDGILCMSLDNEANRIASCKLTKTFRYSPKSPQTLIELLVEILYQRRAAINGKPQIHDYEAEWNRILRAAKRASKDTYLSGFVAFDDTPRRGNKATVYTGANPEKFERYLKKLLSIALGRGDELLFLSAWNEWGEGMYLEPDELNGYAWLEAVKNARLSVGM